MNTHFTTSVRAVLATAVLAFIAALPAAHAQVSGTATVANVPFAFEYNAHQLPAGRYTITRANDAAMEVRGDTASSNGLTVPGTDPDRTGRSRLVFHRYGEHYFLSNVIDRNGNKISIATSKGEKKARHGEEFLTAQTKSGAKPVNVEVAAEVATR